MDDLQLFSEWVQKVPIIDKDNITPQKKQQTSPLKTPVDDEIDFHGWKLDIAIIQLERFLQRSIDQGYRCVRIIHGKGLNSKGEPVLKNGIRTWLKNQGKKYIIKSAEPDNKNGGSGAILVSLNGNYRTGGKT